MCILPNQGNVLSIYIDTCCYNSKEGVISGTYTIKEGTKSLANFAFASQKNLTSIIISDGVRTIPLGAFNRCYSLTSVSLPDSVTDIGADAFAECSADLTIRCYKDSKAAEYAKANGITYIYLDDEEG